MAAGPEDHQIQLDTLAPSNYNVRSPSPCYREFGIERPSTLRLRLLLPSACVRRYPLKALIRLAEEIFTAGDCKSCVKGYLSLSV